MSRSKTDDYKFTSLEKFIKFIYFLLIYLFFLLLIIDNFSVWDTFFTRYYKISFCFRRFNAVIKKNNCPKSSLRSKPMLGKKKYSHDYTQEKEEEKNQHIAYNRAAIIIFSPGTGSPMIFPSHYCASRTLKNTNFENDWKIRFYIFEGKLTIISWIIFTLPTYA